MSCVIIIPARIGSTRLPKKVLADINGLPMIAHVAKNAIAANIADVFVATDSSEVQDILTKHNIKSILTDPNLKSGTDRVFAGYHNLGKKYDYIINVQGDIPNIKSHIISQTYDLSLKTNAEISTPISLIADKDKIYKVSVVKPVVSFIDKKHGKALYFTRSAVPHCVLTDGDLVKQRDVFPNIGNFYEHIGLYVYTHDSLGKFVSYQPSMLEVSESLEQLRALENNMSIYVQVVDEAPISVDIVDDLESARKICFT